MSRRRRGAGVGRAGIGFTTGNANLIDAVNRVEAAIMATTPKMQSQAAGKMGHSTTQVGDLVVAALR